MFFAKALGPVVTAYPNLSEADKAMLVGELHKLDALRDRTLSSQVGNDLLEDLATYHSRLHVLFQKFNIGDDGIKIAFGWFNASGKDTKHAVASHDLRFEGGAILFNLAVTMGVVAEGATAEADYKRGLALFQQAAGVVDWLHQVIGSGLLIPPSCDLHAHHLEFLAAFFLASAQECFTLKALGDRAKDSLVAKLADGTAELFERTARLGDTARSFLSEQILRSVNSRALHYRAVAQFRRSAEALAGCRYGEEVARLQSAAALTERVAASYKRDAIPSEIASLSVQVQAALKRATKDNNIIYHEPLPTELVSSAGVVMAKSSAYAKKEIPTGSYPLSDLLPDWDVQLRITQGYKQKMAICEHIKENMKGLEESEKAALAELGLPAALEAVESPSGIPEAVLAKAAEVRAKGGLEGIRDTIAGKEKARQECEDIFRAVSDALRAENEQDNALRKIYGQQWARPASSALTENLRARLSSLRTVLSQAEDADLKVRDQVATYEAAIGKLLSEGMQLPECPRIEGSAAAQELRQLLDLLTATVADRQGSVTQTCKPESELPVLEQMLASCSGEHAARSQELLGRIRSVAGHLAATKQTHASIIAARQSALQELDAAYQAYVQLHAYLDEGTAFYANLRARLEALQVEASDYSMCRQLEADDFKEHLNEAMELESKKKAQAAAQVQAQQQQAAQLQAQQQQAAQVQAQQATATVQPQKPQAQPSSPLTPGQWNPSMPVTYASAEPAQSSAASGGYAYPPYPPQQAQPQQHYPAHQPGQQDSHFYSSPTMPSYGAQAPALYQQAPYSLPAAPPSGQPLYYQQPQQPYSVPYPPYSGGYPPQQQPPQAFAGGPPLHGAPPPPPYGDYQQQQQHRQSASYGSPQQPSRPQQQQQGQPPFSQPPYSPQHPQ